MTPDQHFRRWVRIALVVFAGLFLYYLIADAFLPVTPQARVLRTVTRIAPQVSGPVVDVAVANNQPVQAGQVLFRIDPEPYQLAVRKAALALEQVTRDNAALDADLAAARARLASVRAAAEQASRQRQRAEALGNSGNISRQQYDALVSADRSAAASVQAARASVTALTVKRGETGDRNLRLRQAQNVLATARLNLDRTTVRAPQAGWISNQQLAPGDLVSAGSPVMAEIGNDLDVVADFREKSLRHANAGERAWVALDGFPGQVFPARLTTRDAGVRDGQIAADGTLTDIPQTDRWVRDAQRIRVHLQLDQRPDTLPPSGARATVQLAPVDSPLARWIGRAQIGLLSVLHYVY